MKGITYLLLLLLPAAAMAQTATDNNSYIKQLGKVLKRSDVSVNTMQYFGGLAKYTYRQINEDDKWGSKYQAVLQKANNNVERFNTELTKIIAKNNTLADKEKMLFKTVVWAGSPILSPVEFLPLFCPIQKEINNQIFIAIENELDNNFKQKLAYSLESIRKTNQGKYNTIIKSGNYNQVKSALKEANFFSSTDTSKVGPEYREIIEKNQERFLRKAVSTTLEKIVKEPGKKEIKIVEIDKNITQLSQFTYKFAEESNIRFENLVERQAILNTKLNNFYDRYQTDKNALDFMQDFLHSKISPTESSAFKTLTNFNLSSTDGTMMTEALALEQEKDTVMISAKEYFNAAAMSIKILYDLGVGDSLLIQHISTAVNIGRAAMSAEGVFTNSNYMGCISCITNLFGGEDVATLRHQQIMQYFNRTDTSITRIAGKIDTLFRAQQSIYEFQKQNFNTLINISDKIDKQYNQAIQQLATIESALYKNEALITSDWESKCQPCLETMKRLKMDIDKGILPDKETLESEYANLKMTTLSACESYLEKFVFDIDKPNDNPDYNLTPFINDVDISTSYNKLDTINRISFGLLFGYRDSVANLKNPETLFYSLFFPSTSIKELNKKLQADSIIFKSTYYPSIPSLFMTIIKPEVSIRHGNIVRNIGFLQNLTDGDRNLISWEQFSSETPPKHRNSKYLLENAIRLNNVAIAQQVILSGDILLPILFEETYKNAIGKGDTAKTAACVSLLKRNEMLAENFTNYAIGASLRKTQTSLMQYAYVFNLNDSTSMAKVLKSMFPVAYIKTKDPRLAINKQKEGWYMTIGKALYPLPAPAAVDQVSILQSKYLPGLLDNREKLLLQIVGFSAYDKKNIENMNYLIMK
ncbi:hypothetical protein [Pedobacter nyackensis]|uniref:hypothetical protein n=1 Tax=Pedobacter nyackensis TaxID=475255 RepID=UPI00292E7037|nr:hypothetical protein [Pedobacter nyackensis]